MSTRYYDLKRLLDTNQKLDPPAFIGKRLNLSRALDQAVRDGHVRIVSLLLEAKVNTNTYGADGETPLHISATQNTPKITQALLRYRAQPSICSQKDRATPLHRACAFGSNDVVKLLIAYHADANALDDMGNTPVMLAAQLDHFDTIALLITSNARGSALPNGVNMIPPSPLPPLPSSFFAVPIPENSFPVSFSGLPPPTIWGGIEILRLDNSGTVLRDISRASMANAIVGAKVRSEWLHLQRTTASKQKKTKSQGFDCVCVGMDDCPSEEDEEVNAIEKADLSIKNNKNEEEYDSVYAGTPTMASSCSSPSTCTGIDTTVSITGATDPSNDCTVDTVMGMGMSMSMGTGTGHTRMFEEAMAAVREAQAAWVRSPHVRGSTGASTGRSRHIGSGMGVRKGNGCLDASTDSDLRADGRFVA